MPVTAKAVLSASTPDPLAAAHARLIKDTGLQFDFTTFTPAKTPDWVIALGRILENLEPLLKVLFWCVVAGLVLALVYFIGRELWLKRWPPARPRSETPKAQWRPTRREAELLLSDADALAAAGSYEEAVHLILLRSIQDIDRHRPAVVKPAFTSREIALLGELPTSARGAFATITHVVERSLFAGAKVGAADFAACRAEYERFAFPDAWTAGFAR